MPDPTAELPWWRRAVFYQIYPRSFCDSDGDGVGDLAGIESHLDHLVWLGVDAIWLSPFFRSPMADFGYDVADYCDVDPLFGSLADFDRLLAACHDRGLRMIIDWVPNHTSDEHPWFVESRATKNSAKRDWYVWRDGTRDEPPNNWRAQFPDGQAWTWDEATSQWYLHLFTPEQPDLDWDNPEVEAAMHDTLRFWLDRGVDGFRMDVVHLIGKDPALADLPEGQERSAVVTNDEPVTHERLRRVRGLLDSYPGERTSVGEVYLLAPGQIAPYYGAHGDELHMAFNFAALWSPWDATAWEANLADARRSLDPIDAWPTWVLSNHDVPRHRTRYGSEARARSAAVLLLTLRGTPFVYAARSSAWKTPSCRRVARSTPVAVTVAGRRSRGTTLPRTGGEAPRTGSRGHQTSTSAVSPASVTIRTRRSASTAVCCHCGARSARSRLVSSCPSTRPSGCSPTSDASVTSASSSPSTSAPSRRCSSSTGRGRLRSTVPAPAPRGNRSTGS
ncbi:MAG: alpha-amylase family glycosyl hydrolase [Ilumatobacteraceae bacterium]